MKMESPTTEMQADYLGQSLLVTGVGSSALGPNLETRDALGHKQALSLTRDGLLDIAVSPRRHCIGYRLPGDNPLTPCPEAVEDIRRSQCDRCLELTAMIPCLRCRGARCMNIARREQCVQPDNHAVYLAAFGREVVKVGVARWPRRFDRLIEQGARAAVIIARDDGLRARRWESMIAGFGFETEINAHQRLACLFDPVSRAELEAMLLRTAERLRRRLLSAPWLGTPEIATMPDPPLVANRPQLERSPAGRRISGRIIGHYGALVIIDREGGEPYALDLNSLIGHKIESSPHAGPREPYQLLLS